MKSLDEAKEQILGPVGTPRRDAYEQELKEEMEAEQAKESVKEYELTVVIYHLENKYSESELFEMFINWAESNNLYVGGSIKAMDQINPEESTLDDSE